MGGTKTIFLLLLLMLAVSLACSVPQALQQAQTAGKTAQGLRTEVGGIVSAGGSLLKTAEAYRTQVPGLLETVKAVGTQGAPILGTIQAVGTNNPGLVQTAQSIINNEIPTGGPPTDLPILDRGQASSYFGSSQYIFYILPEKYDQVLAFYKSSMPENGWVSVPDNSHEFSSAAQLSYSKDVRTATIELSNNPLNQTTVIVINILTKK